MFGLQNGQRISDKKWKEIFPNMDGPKPSELGFKIISKAIKRGSNVMKIKRYIQF